MNKIDSAIIDRNYGAIILTVTSEVELDPNRVVACVDECWNFENIESDTLSDHTFVFGSNNSEVDIDLSDNEYTVKISNIDITFLDTNIKYIKLMIVEYSDAEYDDFGTFVADILSYDPQIIYQAEISTINKYCQSCIDDMNMQLIVYTTFKRQLLENAIQLNDCKTALKIYCELCRILGITLDQSIGNQTNISSDNTTVCDTCIHGMCQYR